MTTDDPRIRRACEEYDTYARRLTAAVDRIMFERIEHIVRAVFEPLDLGPITVALVAGLGRELIINTRLGAIRIDCDQPTFHRAAPSVDGFLDAFTVALAAHIEQDPQAWPA